MTKKEKLYKTRKTFCWLLFSVFGIVGIVSLCCLIVRLASESNPLLAVSLTTSLMFVSAFCFAMAMPNLVHISQVEECFVQSSSYERFRDCIGPFPSILFLERLVFRLAPKESENH